MRDQNVHNPILGRIAIVTDDPGWHGARLKEALAARGYDYRYVSLTRCRIDLNSGGPPVVLPGFEDRLPDGVFVRGVPGGTLDQVILWLDVLHALALLGIPVYNDGRAVERTVDKAMTSFLLHRAGIPTPPTWALSDPEAARAIAERELRAGHALVSKPLFGSQGQGLRRYDTPDDLAGFGDDHGIFYLQRFVHCGEQPHDFRVFVIRGKAVAAMRRCGVTWLNNVHQGARCEPVRLDDRLLCRLAEDAVKVLDMGYAGVDVIRDEHGRYSVLEVNSIPAWKGLQGVTEVSLAELLVDDFLALCRPPEAPEARVL
jgi:tetrahydromethanopterin:alpha-L-glutamate ligase